MIVFPLKRYLVIMSQCYEIEFNVWEAKSPMGLKVHLDGVELAKSLEWQSVVASVQQPPINDMLELMRIKGRKIKSN